MDPFLFTMRAISLESRAAREQLAAFLQRHDLSLDPMLERYFGVFRNNELVAGAGYDRNVIKCAAVEEAYRGEGLLNSLVSQIITEEAHRGITSLMVFTKPANDKIFKSLGFTSLAETNHAVLLINDMHDLQRFQNTTATAAKPGVTGALVMNCNPFTCGHRYLAEVASEACDNVLIFVVEEDVSAFPFRVRLRLVKEGVGDLKNVTVLPGGSYIISTATFPSYFLKKQTTVTCASAEIDAVVFGRHIAPCADIRFRFVGDEPNCPLTAEYNQVLSRFLPNLGVAVNVIPRERHDGEAISASRVRGLLAVGDMKNVRSLVPDTTWSYLIAEEAKPVLERLSKDGGQNTKSVCG